MIHFDPPPEPDDFDTRIRRPGNEWLKTNPEKTPKDFWSGCVSQLADGFGHLCSYAAMHMPVGGGTVDHYLSKSKYPALAYEWSNYRYAGSKMNSRKGASDERILDPFEVEDGWFELQLSSLQLVMTDTIPAGKRDRARFTLERLKLRKGPHVLPQRREYYRLFMNGDLTLGHLDRFAPLISRAVRRALKELIPPEHEQEPFQEFLRGRHSLGDLDGRRLVCAHMARESLPPAPCARRSRRTV